MNTQQLTGFAVINVSLRKAEALTFLHEQFCCQKVSILPGCQRITYVIPETSYISSNRRPLNAIKLSQITVKLLRKKEYVFIFHKKGIYSSNGIHFG
jgi:hypothetical protein